MLNYTLDVTAAPMGAAFPGAGSPWAIVSAAGMSHVPMPSLVQVAAGPVAGPASFRQIPAMATPQPGAIKGTGLPSATQNRTHDVYKTRVNAAGDGASGPHPERGPA